MKVKIYDYTNNAKEIEIPDDKHIRCIIVNILSGDETGYVCFEEGGCIQFNASDYRCISYNDNTYIIEGDDVKKWIEWKPNENDNTYSYDRSGAFSKW